MKTAVIVPLLFLALLTLASCDDDDPVVPDQFSVTIEVVDIDGNPVSGLDLSLAADLPYYQDKADTQPKASVRIPFAVAYQCSVRLFIEDIDGAKVRNLSNLALPAGQHMWIWDGKDDDDNRLASGLYTVHFIVLHLDSFNLLYEERKSMYMAIIDPARKSVGTTDGEGLIKLTDKRMFPNLYDAPDIPARDENGTHIGTIHFTDSMRFQLTDLANSGTKRFYEDITGTTTLQVVWSFDPKSQVVPLPSKSHEEPELLLDEFEYQLGNPYPVPFN